MFSWEYPPHMVGGLGQHVFDLSRFLVNQGIEVHVITPSVEGYNEYEFNNLVHIHRVDSPIREAKNFKAGIFKFNSEAIRAAVKLNTQVNGFNLVHAHDWLVAYAGRSIAKIFNLPLVSTIHATEYGRNLGLHNRMQIEINEIEKNLATEADRVICCSNYMQNAICNLFGLMPDDITIIPNGVDSKNLLCLPEDPEFKVNEEDQIVFFIGRLVPEKGVWQLINAFSQVLKSVPNAKLVIAGKGQKKVLEELVKKLGIKNRVFFTGFIRDKERNYVYNKASVAVFPSLYEPFGIVALEAMITNTPVIVGDVGGLSEIIENMDTGIKVKPGDEDELATAIVSILLDDKLANTLKTNALKLVESIYNWEVVAKSTIEVYKQAIFIKQKKYNIE